jgi:Mu transposase, C-terminal
VAARHTPIRQMPNQHTFFLDLLPGERRKIRRDGIRLFNIHYWDNVLSPLAGRISAPVLVKFDPRDLSTLHYQDEQGNYWAVPCRDLGAPPFLSGNIARPKHPCVPKATIPSMKLICSPRCYSSVISWAPPATRRETWLIRHRKRTLAHPTKACLKKMIWSKRR